MKKILITGVTGFAGSHLADFALAKGHMVFGACRWRSPLDNIKHLRCNRMFRVLHGDLTDAAAVRSILEATRPDFIFHLAAQSFIPTSFAEPSETFHTNVLSEINLLNGVRDGLAGGILVAGSSEEYGLVHENETPITEDQPLRPLSPYAVSKVAQDLLAYQYHQSYKIRAIRTRAFNHEGPRRGYVFVISNFAKQIAEIEAGIRPPELHHGNLSAIRDFGDVRDTVRAYWLLMESGKSGEVYNVATGEGVSIAQVLDTLLKISTVKDIKTVIDPTRMRPSDVPLLVGSAKKLKMQTEWTPRIPVGQTICDTLDYWREQVKNSLALEKKAM